MASIAIYMMIFGAHLSISLYQNEGFFCLLDGHTTPFNLLTLDP